MIRATSSVEGWDIEPSLQGVAVYLDNWAVIELAEKDRSRRRRFVDALCTGGDLLFSVANVAELTKQRGASFDVVKNFLDELGPHWFPVESNAFEVVERERQGMGFASCLSSDFMKAYFVNRTADYSIESHKLPDLPQDFFRLGAVMDWVANSDSILKKSADFGGLFKKVVLEYRIEHERNPSRLDEKFLTFDPEKRATFVWGNLIKTLSTEPRSHQIKDGDGWDFCHAVVGSAFASFATLDKAWKHRVENLPKLPKPNNLAPIYSAAELDQLVTDIESIVKYRGSPR